MNENESLPTHEPLAAEVPSVSDGDSTPYLMRITASGKIGNFVKFAMNFLQSHSNRPLVLHTLPPSKSSAALQDSAAAPQDSATASNHNPTKKPAGRRPQALHPSTVTIPRLISVVEIIKREFVTYATIQERKVVPFGQERNPPLRLHQYNFVGVLEDDHESARNAPLNLAYALSGKNHVKIKKTPYMKIYLCGAELPAELIGSATYQEPLIPPKKSRATKSRERKHRKKLAIALSKQKESNGDAHAEANDAAMELDGGSMIHAP